LKAQQRPSFDGNFLIPDSLIFILLISMKNQQSRNGKCKKSKKLSPSLVGPTLQAVIASPAHEKLLKRTPLG
jgi:hypothetical protein